MHETETNVFVTTVITLTKLMLEYELKKPFSGLNNSENYTANQQLVFVSRILQNEHRDIVTGQFYNSAENILEEMINTKEF